MSTHARFKEALERIAGGCVQPRVVAAEALRSRVQLPDPNSKRQIRQKQQEKSRSVRLLARAGRKQQAASLFFQGGLAVAKIADELCVNSTTIRGDISEYIRENCPMNCFYLCEHRSQCSLKERHQ